MFENTVELVAMATVHDRLRDVAAGARRAEAHGALQRLAFAERWRSRATIMTRLIARATRIAPAARRPRIMERPATDAA